jgi:threonine aldolase
VFVVLERLRLNTAENGGIAIERIAAAIKPQDLHFARTRLLALENTIGGRILPPAYQREATAFAHAKGLRTHLDGARLFNAIVAQPMRELDAVAGFDSVSICLSKGLGAPVGSVLLGSREIIDAARRWRKVLGGGMRQSGILAAAGLYALDHHVARLAEDHENAAYLAAGLRELGLCVSTPQTNIVYVDVPPRLVDSLAQHLLQQGIRASLGPRTRLVTHLDVSRADVTAALQAFRVYPDWAADEGPVPG